MKRLLLAGASCSPCAVPAQASPARFAIGIQKGADVNRVAGRVESATGHPVTKIGSFALSVQAREAGQISAVRGVSWVERDRASRRLAFSPNDPFAVRQWYLGRIHAFDAWPQVPHAPAGACRRPRLRGRLQPPELQNQIVDGRSFVVQRLGERHERPRHLRRRRDRGRAQQQPGHRGSRLPGPTS